MIVNVTSASRPTTSLDPIYKEKVVKSMDFTFVDFLEGYVTLFGDFTFPSETPSSLVNKNGYGPN